MKAKIVIKVTYSIHKKKRKKKKDTRVYLAYILIVFNYNEHPHTPFIPNEDLKMFFIRVLKDRAFFFFFLLFQEEKMSKRSPNGIFLQRGERNKVS